MKIYVTILWSLIVAQVTFAQFTSVTYDYDRNWFNEGQALPVEESMIFKGKLPAGTEIVEMTILSDKKQHELYRAKWAKISEDDLSLIVPYKLRPSDQYDFSIQFFEEIPTYQKEQLTERLMATLHMYIDVNLTGAKSIKFRRKNKKVTADMNKLLQDGLANYRSKQADWNPQFSELIVLKIEQLEKADLDQSFTKKDSTMTKSMVRKNTKQQLINELKDQIDREIAATLQSELYVLTNTRLVDNYPTEEKENGISLNLGYGGVYISGDLDDFTYGASPYLGLAFPLGNSVLGSKFLSNTSVTLGVFTDNFKDEDGNKVSGLVVNRPIYLGLDHKLFKFIRINAGAAFLERETISTLPDGASITTDVLIRPYVGLSARIDLSFSLGR